MKRLVIAAMMLALSGCATIPAIPTSPAVVADATVLDEKAALGVELAYQAAAQAALTANRTGLLSEPMKAKVKAADNRAYAAVRAVRAAYSAGNASSYDAAAKSALAAVAAFLAAVKG